MNCTPELEKATPMPTPATNLMAKRCSPVGERGMAHAAREDVAMPSTMEPRRPAEEEIWLYRRQFTRLPNIRRAAATNKTISTGILIELC